MLKISIVMPSFNQGELLEETITSVLSQGYPNIEYIIIDSGSTDGSLDIVKRYSDKLTYWISEPDKGIWDALNKGFKQSTGEIMAWLVCGDKYLPWTFEIVSQIFNDLSNVDWLASSTSLILNNSGIVCHRSNFLNLGRRNSAINYESVFWRRSLWEQASNDFEKISYDTPIPELWSHFWKYTILHTTTMPLAAVRYGRSVSLATTNPVKFWQSFSWKFLLSLPFMGYIAGYTRGRLSYNAKINRWYCPRLLSGNIIRLILESASRITRLIFS